MGGHAMKTDRRYVLVIFVSDHS